MYYLMNFDKYVYPSNYSSRDIEHSHEKVPSNSFAVYSIHLPRDTTVLVSITQFYLFCYSCKWNYRAYILCVWLLQNDLFLRFILNSFLKKVLAVFHCMTIPPFIYLLVVSSFGLQSKIFQNNSGYIIRIRLSVVLTIWNILPLLVLIKEALIWKMQIFQSPYRAF